MPLIPPEISAGVQLIVQYFTCGHEDRQKELDACLRQNLENRHIGRIHLLTEDMPDLSRFGNPDKIVLTVIRERLTYERAFQYANQHDNGGTWVLANADIYFDESLRHLRGVDLTGRIFALTRHDIQKDGSLKMIPPVYGQGTQDAWIFRTPVSLKNMSAGFRLGVPGCDSRIAYELGKAGYRISNPSRKIIARHLDLTREPDPLSRAREYRGMNSEENIRAGKVVPPPYLYVFPTGSLNGIRVWEQAKKYAEVGTELMKRRPVLTKKCAKRPGDRQENMYASGAYIANNPTLDAEDVPWKITKLVPLVDLFLQRSGHAGVRILDVGGGAGLYLKEISDHIRASNITVEKHAVDLSVEMLRRQQENNPDLESVVEGSIEKTLFRDKEFDLVLMVDVLEHVSDVPAALRELKRIAKYVIFKVPMENNLYYNLLNLIKMGGLRRDIFRKVGHLNFYSFGTLRRQLESIGAMVRCDFTNVFEFYLSEGYHRKTGLKERMVFSAAAYVFRLSPRLCARLFPDSVACLVQCR
ncbi:MAG: class I SAM-dependent methyltransferase [Nitrospirae bacterium]|nr:class I SAM-dependent methyltransferase [Nitrospirota bacterium]